MSNWETMQSKVKVLIDDAFKLIKSGASEAEYLAGATASAAKLHMTLRKNQIEKYKLLHELGEIAFEQMGSGKEFKPTKRIGEIVEAVSKMESENAAVDKELAKISVVKKD